MQSDKNAPAALPKVRDALSRLAEQFAPLDEAPA
jgi:hypothetical protein